jgi:adenine specific DNA methylase Mod
MNRLYFGDNLKWLSDRKEFPDASVDLVYLDPPFNSNADYNVLFREPSGQVSQAQFHAFTDTWRWLCLSKESRTRVHYRNHLRRKLTLGNGLRRLGTSRLDEFASAHRGVSYPDSGFTQRRYNRGGT